LEALPPEVPIRLRLDSQYVQKGITEWMPGWKRKGWKTAAGTPVKNRDLWETLDRLVSGRRIVWEWVRGHCGDPENERCDSLVGEARRLRAGQDRWVDD
jgi:ribonuclease HI